MHTKHTAVAALLGIGLVLGMGTAHAQNDYDGGEKRNRQGNDCNHSQAECQDNDFSPSFDKSPVEDSFNPTICLPFAHCNTPDRDEDEEGSVVHE